MYLKLYFSSKVGYQQSDLIHWFNVSETFVYISYPSKSRVQFFSGCNTVWNFCRLKLMGNVLFCCFCDAARLSEAGYIKVWIQKSFVPWKLYVNAAKHKKTKEIESAFDFTSMPWDCTFSSNSYLSKSFKTHCIFKSKVVHINET